MEQASGWFIFFHFPFFFVFFSFGLRGAAGPAQRHSTSRSRVHSSRCLAVCLLFVHSPHPAAVCLSARLSTDNRTARAPIPPLSPAHPAPAAAARRNVGGQQHPQRRTVTGQQRIAAQCSPLGTAHLNSSLCSARRLALCPLPAALRCASAAQDAKQPKSHLDTEESDDDAAAKPNTAAASSSSSSQTAAAAKPADKKSNFRCEKKQRRGRGALCAS